MPKCEIFKVGRTPVVLKNDALKLIFVLFIFWLHDPNITGDIGLASSISLLLITVHQFLASPKTSSVLTRAPSKI